MKKVALFLAAVCMINFSCTKTQPAPVSYSVTNNAADTTMEDIYVPDTGYFTMPVIVRFLQGPTNDTVHLSITGLPANVTVSPSSYDSIPSFTTQFAFATSGAPLGTHQLTLTASVTGEAPRVYNFNMTVLPANSANIFSGSFTTSNACSASNYTYQVSCLIPDTVSETNVMYIQNFGGYGPGVYARVLFNPYNGTISVPYQLAGNGAWLSGSGTYSQTTLVINYSAVFTPGGTPDNCTATIAK